VSLNITKSACIRIAAILGALSAPGCATVEASGLELTIGHLERRIEDRGFEAETPPLPPPGGLAGSRLGIVDANASGAFRGQHYRLEETVVEPDGDFAAATRALLDRGVRVLVVRAGADDTLVAADLAAQKGAIVFDAGSPDVRLRQQDCRADLFHTLPSRDMAADGLMQYLAKRRWSKLMLVVGPLAGDTAAAEAYRAAAAKFGLKIVEERTWSDPTDGRTVAQEVPVLTQARDYDAVVIADEGGDFGRAFPYATWLPRPVVGSHGLVHTAWNDRVRGWGAAQIQDRFVRGNGRSMDAYDYASWIAVRAVAEAVTRSGSTEPAQLARALVDPGYALGGFKGARATFRKWNRQMRQPIALTHGEGVTAFAPIEGFAHRVSELDTLGVDEPESRCPYPSRVE
jgi:ABC transporter substrate binding protein (PQQ-dependent alcohol dehydrogenase system)